MRKGIRPPGSTSSPSLAENTPRRRGHQQIHQKCALCHANNFLRLCPKSAPPWLHLARLLYPLTSVSMGWMEQPCAACVAPRRVPCVVLTHSSRPSSRPLQQTLPRPSGSSPLVPCRPAMVSFPSAQEELPCQKASLTLLYSFCCSCCVCVCVCVCVCGRVAISHAYAPQEGACIKPIPVPIIAFSEQSKSS
jgi:hypothetical protein